MEKVIRDGHVAVLVSPGYGAGWYSWNLLHDIEDSEELLFCPELVALVESGSAPEALEGFAREKWPDACILGLKDLSIVWVPVGTKFRVHEYDGSESLVALSIEHYIQA